MTTALRDYHLQRITEAIADAFEAGAINPELLPITIAAAAADVKTGKVTTFTLILTMGWDEITRAVVSSDAVPLHTTKKRGN